MYKYKKILIKLTITFLIIFLLIIFAPLLNRLFETIIMNVVTPEYNQSLVHTDYNDYQIDIPFSLIPLQPNKIGLKRKVYHQLKNIDTNLNYYVYENINYEDSFKTNKFDNYSFEIDNENFVVSLSVNKRYKNDEFLNFKKSFTADLQLLKNFYKSNYTIYKNTSKKFKQIRINWSNDNYIIDMFILNYHENNVNSPMILYSISFSKVNKKEIVNYLKDLDKNYLKFNGNYFQFIGIE